MTMEKYIDDPKYKILEYSIDDNEMILYVSEIVSAQDDIPKTIDGNRVEIVMSI